MKIYTKIMDGVAVVEKFIIGIILFGEVALVAGNVLSRYVLHRAWSWTEEIVVASMVLMSVLGAALCAREKGGLVSLTLFTDKMPRKVRIVLDIIMTVLSIVFAVIMLIYGIKRCQMQIKTHRMTSLLVIPEWYYSCYIPIGGGFITLHLIERILQDISELRQPEEKKEESAE